MRRPLGLSLKLNATKRDENTSNTVHKLYSRNFKTNDMIKTIFDETKIQMDRSRDNPHHIELLSMIDRTDDEFRNTDFKRISHARQGFSYDPNHKIEDFKSFTFIPKKGNVTKIYDCKDSAISEYNILREISMQTYANKVLANIAGIRVPGIVSFSRLSPEDVSERFRRTKYFIEMEKIPCDNLKEFLIKHVRSINTPGIFDKICDKVNYALDIFEMHHFYHNDLHHENILVCGTLNEPVIYFIDFGNSTSYNNAGTRDFRLTPEKLIILIEDEIPKSRHSISFNSLKSSTSKSRSRSQSGFKETFKRHLLVKKRQSKHGIKLKSRHKKHFERLRKTFRKKLNN
jgi:hypothetical protein